MALKAGRPPTAASDEYVLSYVKTRFRTSEISVWEKGERGEGGEIPPAPSSITTSRPNTVSSVTIFTIRMPRPQLGHVRDHAQRDDSRGAFENAGLPRLLRRGLAPASPIRPTYRPCEILRRQRTLARVLRHRACSGTAQAPAR